MLANGTGATHVRRAARTGTIVYPDYAFGQDMTKSFSAAVKKAGGTVRQKIATPFPNENFATFITKASDGKPDVIGTMHAGGDLVNFVKQYNQAGLQGKTQLAVGPDVHHRHPQPRCRPVRRHHVHRRLVLELRRAEQGLGRQVQGQDQDPPVVRPRRRTTRPPCSTSRPSRPPAPTPRTPSSKKLEGKKINDVFLRNGEVRAADHRVLHDAYLVKVKPKDQVKEEWDYEEIVKTIPAAEAFNPTVSPDCKM